MLRVLGLAILTSALLTLAAVSATPESDPQAPAPSQLKGVGDATQLIEVTAPGYGTTYATLRAWRRQDGRWQRVFGPWQARIGNTGFAAPGRKREGDGHTPSGAFPLTFAFGVAANPGTSLRWRHAGRQDVWDDDPSSPRYNLWTDLRRHSAGADPEPMHDVPAYLDGVVIGYNRARRPGLGSAIFLHVNIGQATTGCVTVSRPRVIELLRWLKPGQHPRIVMGPVTAVRKS